MGEERIGIFTDGSAVVKRALSVKVKLLIYWSIHVSTLTQSHELWVETKKKDSADTSERNELAGLSIRNLIK